MKHYYVVEEKGPPLRYGIVGPAGNTGTLHGRKEVAQCVADDLNTAFDDGRQLQRTLNDKEVIEGMTALYETLVAGKTGDAIAALKVVIDRFK